MVVFECLVAITGRIGVKMVADQEELKVCQEAMDACLEKM
jgi:hypothetical protein